MGIYRRKCLLTKEERRRQILDVAGKLFLAKGLQGTSMQDIARQSEISRAGLYTYFGNKDEIFSAALSLFIDLTAESVEFELQRLPAEASLYDKLHAIFSTRLRFWYALENQQPAYLLELLERQKIVQQGENKYPIQTITETVLRASVDSGEITKASNKPSFATLAAVLNIGTSGIVFASGDYASKSAQLGVLLTIFVDGLTSE